MSDYVVITNVSSLDTLLLILVSRRGSEGLPGRFGATCPWLAQVSCRRSGTGTTTRPRRYKFQQSPSSSALSLDPTSILRFPYARLKLCSTSARWIPPALRRRTPRHLCLARAPRPTAPSPFPFRCPQDPNAEDPVILLPCVCSSCQATFAWWIASRSTPYPRDIWRCCGGLWQGEFS